VASVCACGEYFNVNDAGELCLNPGTMGLREILVFKEPGTYQFRKEDYPWLARIRVQVQGGGGGSAGADAANDEAITRPGGAGGGYSMSLLEADLLGDVETIAVGAGGAGGEGNNAGGAGGSSSFAGIVLANGGDGSPANMTSGTTLNTQVGVPGPGAGTGQLAYGGSAGGTAFRLSGGLGVSGGGGDSRFGYGGFARSNDGVGTLPRGYGAGAGGAASNGGNRNDGAAGGTGLVMLELYG
jgi:hypothetical protein